MIDVVFVFLMIVSVDEIVVLRFDRFDGMISVLFCFVRFENVLIYCLVIFRFIVFILFCDWIVFVIFWIVCVFVLVIVRIVVVLFCV